MTRYGRRPLGAYLDGYAALWAFNNLRDRAADSIRHHEQIGRPEIAQAIREAMGDLREAAQQHLAASGTSGAGSAEAAPDADPESSEAVPFGGTGRAGTRAASEALHVSERRVRQLLATGQLAGQKDSGDRWTVDTEDLQRLINDRGMAA